MRFAAVASAKLGLSGLWHYLITRAELRAALEKERERNRAFAAHREGLREDSGTELVDYEDHEGRKLWISKSCLGGSCPGVPHPPAMILDLRLAQIQDQIPPVGDSRSAGELAP